MASESIRTAGCSSPTGKTTGSRSSARYGEYLAEWTDVRRPARHLHRRDDLVYVAELSWFPGEVSSRLGPVTEYLPARLSIYDIDGNLLLRWADPDPTKAGYFTAPHGIWVDNEGSIYLAEVADIWSVSRGFAPLSPSTPEVCPGLIRLGKGAAGSA